MSIISIKKMTYGGKSMTVLKNILLSVVKYFDNEGNEVIEENNKSILDLVEDAKCEWLAAKEYFETVSDPDLIDYAILSIEATEKRYNYLLKQVKQMEAKEIK